MTVDTTTRLNALRELMRKPENDVSAYVVPSEDQRELLCRSCLIRRGVVDEL